MSPSSHASGIPKSFLVYAVLLAIGIGILIFLLVASPEARPSTKAQQSVPARTVSMRPERAAVPAPANPPVRSEVVAAQGRQFDWFTPRPFAVAKVTGAHEWTKEDGKSIEAITAIAHNQTEVQRLVDENPRIRRRQLVYRKEPAFELVQRARGAGERLQKLTLPGLDGMEIEMEIVNEDLAPSGLRGTLSGRLPGRGLSMVTLSFKEGREAFSIISPEDGIFLQAHPREPGEIILTSFIPEKYMPLPGGEPIRTAQSSSPQK